MNAHSVLDQKPACNIFQKLFVNSDVDPEMQKLKIDREALVRRYNLGTEHSNFSNSLRAEVDHQHQTVRVFPIIGKVHSEAKARVIALHGMGANTSTHRSMREIVAIIGNPNPGKPGGTLSFLQAQPQYIKLASEAIDQPGSGVGPPLKLFKHLDDTIHWYAQYLKAVKDETPKLPLIVLARSASPRFISEINVRIPGLIDGMVFISPELPGIADLIPLQKMSNLHYIKAHNIVPNETIMDWFQLQGAEISWTPEHFGKTPTLILTGSADTEVLAVERLTYKLLANRNTKIKYLDIDGADHDVFDTQRQYKKSGREAFLQFYSWVHELTHNFHPTH